MQCLKPMTPEKYHWTFGIIPTIVLFADLAIRIGLSIRIILRKRPQGTTFAWLILLLPFLGAFVYLLFGENRLSEKRAAAKPALRYLFSPKYAGERGATKKARLSQ